VFHGFIDIAMKKIVLYSHVTNASFWVIKFNVLHSEEVLYILYDTGHCGISRNKTKPRLKIVFFIFLFLLFLFYIYSNRGPRSVLL